MEFFTACNHNIAYCFVNCAICLSGDTRQSEIEKMSEPCRHSTLHCKALFLDEFILTCIQAEAIYLISPGKKCC